MSVAARRWLRTLGAMGSHVHRGRLVMIAAVAILSLVVSVYLGSALHVWSLHNVDLFPDSVLDATHTFYRLPATVTQQLLPAGLADGAPRSIWVLVLFAGVLVQNLLLLILVAVLRKKVRRHGT